ncbi:MAG: hypothetical protein A2V93_09835 [Ignavibacteria bacterium RBG_16_34_14]|nr:MAG: hypothetical protein A2V93_09835 [Ignavibacteria bacterium RBG_16_34_14]
MKKLNYTLIVSLLLVTNIFPQWHAYGPKGGYISNLIKSGSHFFASSSEWIPGGIYVGGLFHSSDDGLNWQTLNTSWSNEVKLISILYYNNILFAGTDSGLYKTYDLGGTWSKVTNGLTGHVIQSIRNDNANNLYVSTSDSGFFRSDNVGSNWVQKNNGLSSISTGAFEVIDNEMWINTSASQVHMSTDYGENWLYTNSLGFFSVTKDDSLYYMSRYGPNYFIERSVNGTSWGGSLLYGYATYDLDYFPPYIYAGTGSGLFFSTDRGESWVSDSIYAINSFLIDSQLMYAATGGEGIHRTPLAVPINIIWEERNNGIHITFNNYLLKKDNYLFSGAPNGIFRSTDDGVNWSLIYPASNIACLLENDNRIFAGVSYSSSSPVFYSDDNGIIWNPIDTSLSSYYTFGMTKFNDKIFACTESAIYSSTNNGGDWQKHIVTGGSGYYMSIAHNDSNLFVSDAYRQVFKSSDEGNSWALVYTSPNTINTLTADSVNVYLGTWNAGILVSTDNGLTWTGLNNGLPPNAKVKCIWLNKPYMVAGLLQGVYSSTDYGDSWSPFGEGIKVPVNHIISDDNYLYAASTGSGVFIRPLSEITIVWDSPDPTVISFSLYQNYPNPFNPSTKIRFTISDFGFTILKVYDVLGNEVATLVDEELSAGEYEVEFQSTVANQQLASGVYFYQLKGVSFIQTRKMILIR